LDPQDRYRQARIAGIALVMPFLMLAGPLVGLFGGRWLDSLFGTKPWIEMIGLVLGLIAGGQQVHLMYLRLRRDLESKD
jgi:F0F1-type ATP synthase assembly protein I